MNHRSHRASVSLVLAAAIAAALTGCGNGTPTTKSEVIGPMPFSQGAVIEGQQSADVSGQVTFEGAPLANAQLRVVDAMSDAPVDMVAPSGGNVVAPGGANLTTDADGRFHFQLAGIAPGQVVRVTATADGKTLSTLINGNGQAIGQGRSVQSLGVTVPITTNSTMLALMADGALRMSGLLQPKAAAAIVNELFDKMQSQMATVAAMNINPRVVVSLVSSIDADTGHLSSEAASQLNTMLVSSGNLQTWLDMNRSTFQAILMAIRTRSNLNPALFQRLGRLQRVPLPGTGMTVSLDERFLTIVGTDGAAVRLDLTDYAQLEAMANSPAFQKAFQMVSATVAGQAKK